MLVSIMLSGFTYDISVYISEVEPLNQGTCAPIEMVSVL